MEYRKRNFSRPRIGQQLGNYRLTRLLGRGSFADVYLGEHIHLNTQAAIKVLDMRLTNDDMGDFLKEARTIARLKHPSIIQVLEFGIENNTPFLVMDYAPNGTLRSHFPKGSHFSPEDIQPYVMQIASALQHAHNEKLIHRDIKPENILLGSNNEVLLNDLQVFRNLPMPLRRASMVGKRPFLYHLLKKYPPRPNLSLQCKKYILYQFKRQLSLPIADIPLR